MTYLIVVVIATGILAQVVSGMLRLPSIIFLLVFGVALGPHGFSVIDPRSLGAGLEVVVTLSVAIILFEGSMSLNLRHIRKVHRSVRRLITIGLLFTFVAAGVAAHFLMNLPPKMAALFGALVTVTGPTVIRPLVRRINVRREIAAILEGEGILIDPIGAILAILCLEFALGHGTTAEHLTGLGIRLGAGVGVGAVIGALTALIVRFRQKRREGLKNLIVLACALGCYGVAEMVRPEAGIVAVVVAGMITQMGMRHHEKELREFKEQLTTLLISVLFVLLAANLDIRGMKGLGLPGLATVLVVMFVARPLNVFYSTRGGAPNFREKLFLSWTAPRGIIAASVASLAAMKLAGHAADLQQEFPALAEAIRTHAGTVELLVFLTIFLTVIAQGSTAGLVARILGIVGKQEGGVVIVGSNALTRFLGKLFQKTGREVTLIDTNPYHCDQAEREGMQAVCGSATDRDVLRHARILDAGTFLACTESARANEMAAQVAHVDYDVKNVLAAIDSEERPELDPILERQGVQLAFGRPIPMDTWIGDLSVGSARIDAVAITGRNTPASAVKELKFPASVVPVAYARDGEILVCGPATKFQEGDTLYVLSHGVSVSELNDHLGLGGE